MHPTLFRVGPVTIGSYGVAMALAFLAGLWLSIRQGRRRDVPAEALFDLMLWCLVGGLAGARGLYVLLDPATTWREFPFYWRQGLTWYGGLAGGVVTALVFSWRARRPFLLLADTCAPALALGYGIARIGCLLNGCCFGAPTALPWGIRFPLDGGSTEPSHPAQLYSALGSWGICIILLLLDRSMRRRGQLFFLYLMLYAIMRTAVEVLRKGYTAEVLWAPLTYAQVASIALFVFSAVAFWIAGRRGDPKA